MNSINFVKKVCMSLLISFLISINPSTSVSAVEVANYAEMTAAIATMIVDMAANHYALQQNQAKATNLLKGVTGILSLTNRGLFTYNSIKSQEDLSFSPWRTRDNFVNGALTALDIAKLSQLIYTLTPQGIMAAREQAKKTADLAIETLAQDPLDAKIDYLRRVFVQPMLTGLSAFAVACTQNYVTSYSSDKARYTAMATHSLATLIEYYGNLEPGSKQEELVILAMVANAFWLIHEGRGYAAELAVPDMPTNIGNCGICMEENVPLKGLGCGNHAYCQGCLRGQLQAQYEGARAQMDQIRCPECAAGAPHHFTRHEIKNITGNDPQFMRAYDVAVFDRVHPNWRNLGADVAALIAEGRAKFCPQCRVAIIKNDGCNHMTCRCGHHFCWVCLQPRGRGPRVCACL
jgi:hypothetical protein